MIDIRSSHIDDADHINVREGDVREIWRTSLSNPNSAVKRAILASRDAWTIFVDDEIMCIFGVADRSLINRVGSPWMIGSDVILDNRRDFLKLSKIYVEKLKFGYDKLVNHVDDENEIAKTWLQWLGFNLEKPEPYGAIGKPFRKFTMEKSHV